MTILHSASQVLRCFSDERPELTLTDIVALRGAPKSSTSRLLNAMRDAGFLEVAKVGRKYRPAPLMIHLAQINKVDMSLLARADAAVRELVEETGHTGYVSALDHQDVIGLSGHEGRQVLRVATAVGRRLQASASATGRALLSRMEDRAIQALYHKGLFAPSERAPATLEDLMNRINQVRQSGYSVAFDETNHGVGAVATVVVDPMKNLALSLCIVFPAATIAEQEREHIITRMKEMTAQLARQFNDHGQPLLDTVRRKKSQSGVLSI
ncbi:MAG: IclR family transcriptional regulator [Beijerinckiaceae bacterium]